MKGEQARTFVFEVRGSFVYLQLTAADPNNAGPRYPLALRDTAKSARSFPIHPRWRAKFLRHQSIRTNSGSFDASLAL